jgi:hypothetical protein
MATADISRTNGTATNNLKWTYSAWLKRGTLGTAQAIATSRTGTSGPYLNIIFDTSDRLNIYGPNTSAANDMNYLTTRVFRDVGAWYHIVVAFDCTLAAAGDRLRIYINGVEETVFTTENNPAQNNTYTMNYTGYTFVVGARTDNSEYWTGEMSHVQFVDGLQLTPTEFGEEDSTSGIWKIKVDAYATPGNNGFFLKMEDRTNLDLDSSSNAHTMTTSGTLTATYDNPSNSFATLNPLNMPTTPKPVFSNGNNTVVTQDGSARYFGGTSTLGMVGGKWYCEFKASSLASNGMVGINGMAGEQARQNAQVSYTTSGYAYLDTGEKKTNASASSYGNSYTTSNVIGVAVDLDNLKIYFAKDNTWQDSGDPTSGATGTGAAFTILAASATPYGYYAFSCTDNTTGSSTWDVNFGNGYFGTTAVTSAEADGAGIGAFEYAPPTGYYALCTKNIKAYGGA